MGIDTRKEWAIERTHFWWNDAANRLGYDQSDFFGVPIIQFSNKMTACAGIAYTNFHDKSVIKYSLPFLLSQGEKFDQTIGHEVAHIVADNKFRQRCKHNSLWAHVMRVMGLEPRRCHQYESLSQKKVISYSCVCGKTLAIGELIYRRMIQKNHRYTCTRCHALIDPNQLTQNFLKRFNNP